MSAFVVSADHINALTSWAEAYGQKRHQLTYWWQGRHRPIAGDGARVAAVLYAENVRSVNSRYGENEPGHGHIYRPELAAARRPPVEILKALQLLRIPGVRVR